MKITEVKVFPVKNSKSSVKAFASVTFDKEFIVTGIRIIDGSKGLFIGMPSQLGKDEEYHDIAFPLTKKCRAEITEKVLEAYEE